MTSFIPKFLDKADGSQGYGDAFFTLFSNLTAAAQNPDLIKRIKQGVASNLESLQAKSQGVINFRSRSHMALLGTAAALLMFVALKLFGKKQAIQETAPQPLEQVRPQENKRVSQHFQSVKRSTSSMHLRPETVASAPAAVEAVKEVPATTKTRAEIIKERALESTHIRKLYDQAVNAPNETTKTGEWSILFLDRPTNGFVAGCRYWERKVELQSSLSDEMAIASFAFELTNGIFSERHRALKEEAVHGKQGMMGIRYIEREEFAKESERIEYQGTVLFYEHMVLAIDEMQNKGWKDEMLIYPRRSTHFEDFEEYYSEIKNGEHTEFWRKTWDFHYKLRLANERKAREKKVAKI